MSRKKPRIVERPEFRRWWIQRDARKHAVPSLEAVFIISCVSCQSVALVSRSEPPQCFAFHCQQCGYDEYHCFVLRALRLTPLPDRKRLQQFRIREADRE
jgi:hypothetical protein